MVSKFVTYIKHKVFPILCADCRIKVARKFGFKHKPKSSHKAKHKKRGKLTGKAKAAFLRRLNKGRAKAGLKPIHAR